MTRVLVCGGSTYTVPADDSLEEMTRAVREASRLLRVLDAAVNRLYMDELIHGGTPGAAQAAGSWAVSSGIQVTVFRANWTLHGPAAERIRDQQMIDEGQPDVVIAFPGEDGTTDLVRRAEASGIPAHRIDWK